MKKILTENAQKFLAKKPVKLGRLHGYDFYEHPTLGDETDIRAITPEGKIVRTYCFDMEDVREWVNSN